MLAQTAKLLHPNTGAVENGQVAAHNSSGHESSQNPHTVAQHGCCSARTENVSSY